MTGDVTSWAGLRVVVAGIGVTGFAAADALLERGAQVVVLDPRQERTQRERGIVLDTLGADIRLGPEAVTGLPADGRGWAGAGPDLLVVSPGWSASGPVVAEALELGVPVWGEAELAWRMRPAENPAPWLTVTGTRGKATTTSMLATMLTAAGLRATATGLAGTSILEAVLHPDPYQVLAVQLSAFQLHWSRSIRPLAAACLNVSGADAADPSVLADRGRVYQNAEIACVYNLADPRGEDLVKDAEVVEGCRAVGFGLGVPAVSNLGLVEDVLCERAFVPERWTSAAELGTLDDIRLAGAGVLSAHTTLNALAAAALARAAGAPPAAVRDGLRGYRPLPHRLEPVAEFGGVTWIDDSAAIEPLAPLTVLRAFEHVVWIAGGTLPAASPEGERALLESLDAVAEAHAGRLRAVVLIGPDRELLRQALERHAPDVPVADVDDRETGSVPVMEVVVAKAAQFAQPGDTVLLSPGFTAEPLPSFDERGAAFAAAVLERAQASGES
jgi:UDP-N-acetylmuramoylalanine--D-glutamate ligase